MRTTLDMPLYLISDVVRLTGSTKKKEARCIALEECVRNHRIEALLAVPGTIDTEGVFKEMDELEMAETYARELPLMVLP
jgi:hypothetical protein